MAALEVAILAAGKGTRMHSRLPKVLHPLAGRPLIAHVVETARRLRPASICVVYGHGGEQVLQALAHSGVVFACQEPQLGTGHALAQALPRLDRSGVTLVLYGDVPLIGEATLQRMLHGDVEQRLTLLTAEVEDPSGYGRIVRDSAGAVVGIVEHQDASDRERAIREINTGILAAPTWKLAHWLARLGNDNAQGEYYLTDVVKMAVEEDFPVATVHPEAPWEILGVNSKLQLAELERIYQRQAARRLMAQGVTLLDPDRIDVRGELTCGRDVVIDVGCVFEGTVTLGDQTRVGPYAIVRDARIGARVEVLPYTLIEGAEVGDDCRIGPYARLRPGARLAEQVHIGNFVEVKNSEIGRASKANHLAYVGDATVGRDVNIGAGTITCNYDGAQKHRTVIEDGAFIGSDTQLVAPVRVGKGATLGAGTTLTRDAPPGKLTLSRAPQVTVDNWARPKKKPAEGGS
ncbi:bifunctional UDP-N-acetylglucosamine diphosphorylase/glucosamine-1-phosphate N-acetyltransferase GlmU [Pelomicrobium methylotrophicum]|uniref:Bifunctional protein GlmU n=1 Tax=Pelomicrobium methylotrophicum TaxID=2602750 RepID=A0A5C7EXQ0_9PROT|nr:bifunctional UDP-N-acetylglucosamine diphosphorylase/glucosamine-1-phosphate N-acetyltransferase GlmU [Pelomicrobium methylotrophicum]TXF13252.1 UDP-N-acetylglucosamine diphosphorylase/glucosamine-1-phosphate N-acetyltransferase [Pelomicrobium methylotrophicum]